MKKYAFITCILLHISVFAEEDCISPVFSLLSPIEIVEENSGLEEIDCIYAINLKERPERWNLLQEQFSEQKLRVNRVEAINGWKIPVEQRNKLVDPRLNPSRDLMLTGGEIGCSLSHLSIYQDALERGFQVIWVCEDDIRFNGKVEGVSSLVEELFWLDPDWDLLYTEYTMFGATIQRYRPEQKPYEILNQPVSDTLVRTHGRFGTHSMILSRKGLEKIMAYFCNRYFWAAIDVDLHYMGLKEYSIKQGLTGIQSRFSSDTQPSSALRNGK